MTSLVNPCKNIDKWQLIQYVALVSKYTYQRLDWCDSGEWNTGDHDYDPDEEDEEDEDDIVIKG